MCTLFLTYFLHPRNLPSVLQAATPATSGIPLCAVKEKILIWTSNPHSIEEKWTYVYSVRWERWRSLFYCQCYLLLIIVFKHFNLCVFLFISPFRLSLSHISFIFFSLKGYVWKRSWQIWLQIWNYGFIHWSVGNNFW